MTLALVAIAVSVLLGAAGTAVRRGWATSVSRSLVGLAVKRLPERSRARWHEEWAADLQTFHDRPLAEFVLALRIAWYAPTIGRTLRGDAPESSSAPGRSEQRERDSLRRYQLRGQAGRLVALAPLAVALAVLGGFLLQMIDAPAWSFYVFAIALSGGTVMQILIRGAGLPRPGGPRGVVVDLETLDQSARASRAPQYHTVGERL